MIGQRSTRRRTAMLATLATLAAGGAAHAALPETIAVDGRLSGPGGTPAADGTYALTFALYPTKDAKVPAWSSLVLVTVQQGGFRHALGADKPLGPKVLEGAGVAWLGVRVAKDPELPRVPLRAVMFARRSAVAEKLACSGCVTAEQLAKDIFAGKLLTAGSVTADKVAFAWAKADKPGGAALAAKSAEQAKTAKTAADLQCTGCVSVAEISFDGDVALGKHTLIATKLLAVELLVQGTVAAAQLVGDGSKITGLKIPKGQCKAGEVVAGVAPDGALKCVVPAASELPKDGLSAVSNGLLSNVFEATAAIAKAVPIPDDDPIGVSAQVIVPDHGLVKTLSVHIELSSSDISGLTVTLYDPKNQAHVLHALSGSGKTLKGSYPAPDKPKSGDLLGWVGQNPKGIWRLKVVDSKKGPGGSDGAIGGFAVQVTWISNDKVAAKSAFLLHKTSTPPLGCDASSEGAVYYDSKLKALRFCDGEAWRVLSDNCGNGVLEQGEQCDDGNNADGDGCSSTCTTKCGDGKIGGAEQCDDGNTKDGDGCSSKCKLPIGQSKESPAKSCKSIKSLVQGSKSGNYWLTAAGLGVFRVYCDMTTAGGGWVLTHISRTSAGNVSSWFPNAGNGAGGVANLPQSVGTPSPAWSKGPAMATRTALWNALGATEYRGSRYDTGNGLLLDVTKSDIKTCKAGLFCFAAGCNGAPCFSQTKTGVVKVVGGTLYPIGSTQSYYDVGTYNCNCSEALQVGGSGAGQPNGHGLAGDWDTGNGYTAFWIR